ncbi:MAG: hypothetical protein VYA51_04705 [Planctomycetota bacterium]|nr:hypothetical protein [Planctomycetota bacterium]MEC8652199.1 hypothetical protein [Planctomycetota bacterium]MEC9047292.1 hypothetical protein [Planctomycetota bacterium]
MKTRRALLSALLAAPVFRASITWVDPDGNVILVDQHVPRPTQR